MKNSEKDQLEEIIDQEKKEYTKPMIIYHSFLTTHANATCPQTTSDSCILIQ